MFLCVSNLIAKCNNCELQNNIMIDKVYVLQVYNVGNIKLISCVCGRQYGKKGLNN